VNTYRAQSPSELDRAIARMATQYSALDSAEGIVAGLVAAAGSGRPLTSIETPAEAAMRRREQSRRAQRLADIVEDQQIYAARDREAARKAAEAAEAARKAQAEARKAAETATRASRQAAWSDTLRDERHAQIRQLFGWEV
jgi:tryptophan 2,3-dioxygenase